jgi:hypothetical protein
MWSVPPHSAQAICHGIVNAWTVTDVDDIVVEDGFLPTTVVTVHLVFE